MLKEQKDKHENEEKKRQNIVGKWKKNRSGEVEKWKL